MAGVELEVGVEGVEEVEEDSLPHSEVGVAMVVEVVMVAVEVTGADAELKIVMLVKIIIAMETSINGINVFFHFIFCVHCLGIFLEKWNKSKYFFLFYILCLLFGYISIFGEMEKMKIFFFFLDFMFIVWVYFWRNGIND